MARDAEADARIARRLEAAGITPAHELVVAHVSAGNPFRRWPEPAFSRLIAGLAAASPKRRIILSSGPSDREAADRIARSGPGGARGRGESGSSILASSTSPSCARSSSAAGCSLAVTRAAARRGHHGDADSGNIWTDRGLSDPPRGATRGLRPSRSRSPACPAGRAISGSVSLAIFDV
jgi:hypothetical protein